MATSYKKLKMLRRSRVMWGSWRLWRPRVVFWAGALAIGLISVGFAKMADIAQDLFHTMLGGGEYNFLLPLILTPCGFALCCWLAFTVFPASQGSGIPQAIAARHLRRDDERNRLLSLRVAAGKIALTIVGLFCGASIGREGPTVQVGASIMLLAARIGGMAQAQGLILAGAAAGIAAAFNTPLAGIVFAIEEMSRTYQARANGLVLTAVILSGLAALGTVGSYTYFGSASIAVHSAREWAAVIVCGIGGGFFGAIFSAGALRLSRRIRRWAAPQPMMRNVAMAAGCGLLVAIIGVISSGSTFGTGYEQARSAIEGEPLPLFYFLGKLASCFLSMVSGIPGGIFAPSLSVGAGFGSTVGQVLGVSVGLAAVLGMAGYFAGVVQAPMTAFVIILEMTDSHEGVISLMIAAMLGYLTSRMISREPLYHGLSRIWVAESIRIQRAAAKAEADAADTGEPVAPKA
ncbi:chloride channel protein [Rhizobium halophytocola]|uniref:H+/Cl- antiporter ClcA n=1 Tax=Rhizobium halophytocola TaxID=735519 RepID=A0ABS4DX26_9HYPH|nr:chloride channel protein [Rhizobium halophytocola]MBP1850244.1 H+/Cl- antiporter ClcA [Rhizobium halophytocola]